MKPAMILSLKTKKSAGVPVTAAVHKAIARGNSARDKLQWTAAAEAYLSAVRAQAELYHIWIQLGHAFKESAKYAEAEDAYRHANSLRPTSSEPLLHLGHLH